MYVLERTAELQSENMFVLFCRKLPVWKEHHHFGVFVLVCMLECMFWSTCMFWLQLIRHISSLRQWKSYRHNSNTSTALVHNNKSYNTSQTSVHKLHHFRNNISSQTTSVHHNTSTSVHNNSYRHISAAHTQPHQACQFTYTTTSVHPSIMKLLPVDVVLCYPLGISQIFRPVVIK